MTPWAIFLSGILTGAIGLAVVAGLWILAL